MNKPTTAVFTVHGKTSNKGGTRPGALARGTGHKAQDRGHEAQGARHRAGGTGREAQWAQLIEPFHMF